MNHATLRRFTIRQRLLGSLGVLSLLMLGLGGWSAFALNQLQSDASQLLDTEVRVAADSSAIIASLERVQRLEEAALLNGNNAAASADLKTAWDKEVAGAQALIKAKSADPSSQAVLAPATEGLAAYASAVSPVLQQVVDAKMDSTAAFAYSGQAAPDLDKARTAASAWVAKTQAAINQRRSAEASSMARDSAIRVGASVAALLVFGAITVLVVQSILAPLAHATRSAERIATGDLSEDIHDAGRDEVARFMRALIGMQGALRTLVGQVRSSADSIQTASVEVASGNFDLSQRTEHAASNLQLTAASMAHLTGTVGQSAEAARQASSHAGSATDVARRGGEAVSRVVQTMDQIQQASRQIADITGVIDGIAFQTNILALNAAVEAARAGEQGRGFAVVASEVRSLAQRSAEAAKEIKTLIGRSVERVESGTGQVRDAGQTMQEIVSSVQRVTDIVGQISVSAEDQNQGMAQVNRSVDELDQMTQQNAALVEQSAAAAESLKRQALTLIELVATFRLGHSQATPGPASSAGSDTRPAQTPRPAAHNLAHTVAPAAAPMPAPSPAPSTARAAPAALPRRTEPPLLTSPVSTEADWESF